MNEQNLGKYPTGCKMPCNFHIQNFMHLNLKKYYMEYSQVTQTGNNLLYGFTLIGANYHILEQS
jgi:hypothetical protein